MVAKAFPFSVRLWYATGAGVPERPATRRVAARARGAGVPGHGMRATLELRARIVPVLDARVAGV